MSARRRPTQKTSQMIAMRIVEDIVDQGFGPGDRLHIEAAMVEHYQVSRATLREALCLLEVQGLVQVRAGRNGGPVVGGVAPEHLARTAMLYFNVGRTTYEEVFLANATLEMEAVGMAADPDRELVGRRLGPYAGQQGPVDDRAFDSQMREFRSAILEATGNRVFFLFASAIRHIVNGHLLASMEGRHSKESRLVEQRQLAQAIIAGKSARAMSSLNEVSLPIWTSSGNNGPCSCGSPSNGGSWHLMPAWMRPRGRRRRRFRHVSSYPAGQPSSTTNLVSRNGMQAFLAAFAADARLLEAAEGDAEVAAELVMADRAGAESAGRPHRRGRDRW